MCVDVLLADMPGIQGSQKRTLATETGVTVISCCGYWVLNLGPIQEQPVFLIPEPSLQLKILIFSMGVKN